VKSKWLEWKASTGILDEIANSEPSKPTQPSSVGFEGSTHEVLAITSELTKLETTGNSAPVESMPSDPYSKRLQAALRGICRPDYPSGMILWLRDAFPLLYVELIDGLPDEMDRLWSRHAPLNEFDRILDVWVEAHRTAFEMYKTSQARNSAQPGPEKLNG
jgi:hypothetical protein